MAEFEPVFMDGKIPSLLELYNDAYGDIYYKYGGSGAPYYFEENKLANSNDAYEYGVGVLCDGIIYSGTLQIGGMYARYYISPPYYFGFFIVFDDDYLGGGSGSGTFQKITGCRVWLYQGMNATGTEYGYYSLYIPTSLPAPTEYKPQSCYYIPVVFRESGIQSIKVELDYRRNNSEISSSNVIFCPNSTMTIINLATDEWIKTGGFIIFHVDNNVDSPTQGKVSIASIGSADTANVATTYNLAINAIYQGNINVLQSSYLKTEPILEYSLDEVGVLVDGVVKIIDNDTSGGPYYFGFFMLFDGSYLGGGSTGKFQRITGCRVWLYQGRDCTGTLYGHYSLNLPSNLPAPNTIDRKNLYSIPVSLKESRVGSIKVELDYMINYNTSNSSMTIINLATDEWIKTGGFIVFGVDDILESPTLGTVSIKSIGSADSYDMTREPYTTAKYGMNMGYGILTTNNLILP